MIRNDILDGISQLIKPTSDAGYKSATLKSSLKYCCSIVRMEYPSPVLNRLVAFPFLEVISPLHQYELDQAGIQASKVCELNQTRRINYD